MKNRKYDIVFLLTIFTTMTAFGNVFDMRSRAFIGMHNSKQRYTTIDIISSNPINNKIVDPEDNAIDYIPTVVELYNIADVDKLKDMGCLVMRTRDNFAIICIPIERVEDVASSGILLRASVSQSLSFNNHSRDFSKVGLVHQHKRDDGLIGYRGKGVVTGFCDIGFDPTHFVFDNRVALMVNYQLEKGIRMVYDTPEAIASVGADQENKTHGTHVANILAGGIDNNPYYGYAPEATIVATTSDLYDASLLCGIEDIIEYARKQDMPCVINLSVGSFIGPHDGTDIVSRYLALITKDVPICFSVGNYGHYNTYFKETFGLDKSPVGAFYESYTWKGFDVHGINDIWSADERDFEMSLAIYDYTDRCFVYQSPWLSGTLDMTIDSGNDSEFARFFADSYVNIYGGIDGVNGRYNMALSFNLQTTDVHTQGWSRYYLVTLLRGDAGVTIESFADGYQSFFHSTGIIDTRYPKLEGSASNFCYAPGVVSVGAYNSSNAVPVYGSENIKFDFNVGEIAHWSSYGTNIYGQSVPMFSAPGNQIVSAMSEKFYNANPNVLPICHEYKDDDGRKYRWFYDCGTSMSSPAVAGIFATWLEADPTLTPSDLSQIALTTVRTEGISDLIDPRWGAGAIDANAGLEKILTSSVIGILPDISPTISVVNGSIRVEVIGSDMVDYEIYDISGKQVQTDTLSPGIYEVRVFSPTCYVAKIVLK